MGKKIRNNKIDAIKGFAILCVVVGHVIQNMLGEKMDSSVIFRLIYSFHMPLFIFISGYTYGKYTAVYDIKWLKNRFIGLVIPFYIWAILHYFIRESVSNTITFEERMIRVIQNPSDNGLWFLITLFWCCLLLCLFYYIGKILRGGVCGQNSSRYYFLCLIVVLLLVKICKISLPIRLDLWYINYFFVGLIIGKADIQLRDKTLKYVFIIIGMALYLICMRKWNRIMTLDTVFPGQKGHFYSIMFIIYRYFVPYTAIFIIFNGVNIFAGFFPVCIKGLANLGKNSLCIYSMHWFFLGIGIGGVIATLIVKIMTATIMPIYVGSLIKKNKFLNTLLLGGRS